MTNQNNGSTVMNFHYLTKGSLLQIIHAADVEHVILQEFGKRTSFVPRTQTALWCISQGDTPVTKKYIIYGGVKPSESTLDNLYSDEI